MKNIFKSLLVGLFGFVFVGSIFARNNDNFIDSGFWAEYDSLGTQAEKDALIINALYGDGTGNTDRTAYTEKWSSVGCNPDNMNVVEITTGWDKLTLGNSYLDANTIYVAEPGNYIAQDTNIYLGTCSAIIGKERINYYRSSQGYGISLESNDTILDNITIYGIDDGQGGIHGANYVNLNYYNISRSMVHNFTSLDASIDLGSANVYINNLELINNEIINGTIDTYGDYVRTIYIENFYGKNTQFSIGYRTGVVLSGISLEDSNLTLDNVSDSVLYNITIFGKATNNTNYFLFHLTNYSSNNYLENIIIYGGDIGLEVSSNSNNNIFNKVMLYNNNIGYEIIGSANNTLNNAQIFNNGTYGVLLSDRLNGGTLLENAINNTQIYNNNIGVYFLDSQYNLFHDVQIYNNIIGIGEESGYYNLNNIYYGIFNIFGNETDLAVREGTVVTGYDNLLGWSTGEMTQPVEPISYNNVIVPKNSLGEILYDKYALATGWIGRKTWVPTKNVSYDVGQFIYMNSNIIVFSGTDVMLQTGYSTGLWYPIFQGIIQCFQTFNISFLDDGGICLGIPEDTLQSLIGQQPVLWTQIQDMMKVQFDLALKNVSTEERALGRVRTRLGEFPLNTTLPPEATTYIQDIKAVVFKADKFEELAKQPAY